MINADLTFGFPMLGESDGIQSLPIRTPYLPTIPIQRPDRSDLPKHLPNEGTRVGTNRRLDEGRELSNFGGVDIHHHFMCCAREIVRRITGDGEIKAGADTQ